MLTGRLQATHSLTQVKSMNSLFKGDKICLCSKFYNGRIVKRIATIVEVNGKTKNDRRFIKVKIRKTNKITRILLDIYGVDPYPNCRWDQTHWIEFQ